MKDIRIVHLEFSTTPGHYFFIAVQSDRRWLQKYAESAELRAVGARKSRESSKSKHAKEGQCKLRLKEMGIAKHCKKKLKR